MEQSLPWTPQVTISKNQHSLTNPASLSPFTYFQSIVQTRQPSHYELTESREGKKRDQRPPTYRCEIAGNLAAAKEGQGGVLLVVGLGKKVENSRVMIDYISSIITTRDKMCRGERLTSREKPIMVSFVLMGSMSQKSLLRSKLDQKHLVDWRKTPTSIVGALGVFCLWRSTQAAVIYQLKKNITIKEYTESSPGQWFRSNESAQSGPKSMWEVNFDASSSYHTYMAGIIFDQIRVQKETQAAELLSLMAVRDWQGVP